MTEPNSSQPPKRQHPSSAEQPTIISNFSEEAAGRSEQQTQHSDLSGGDNSSGMKDSIVTQVMGNKPIPTSEPTRTTDLHVTGAGAKSSKVTSGTHQHQVWGDFELGDLLGRGGMGSVYRGRQISLDRPVAIKVLPKHLSDNDNFRSRFLLEARAVAQLSSPHIVGVYFAGVHEGHHYFAMEYVEGKDLSVRLREGFKPSHLDALKLITQAARGLAVAGDMGLVHRDIKPANMMLTNKGTIKLMDFGLVRATRSEDTGLTMAGTIMGTVSYFSPEQGRGEKCDCRTDIYALGVVFYEILTGQLPFSGGDATSIIYQHIHQEPKPPKEINPSIPESYQAVVLKCLQKKPDHRYKDAHALLDDLAALANGKEPSAALYDLKGLRTGGTIIKEKAFHQEKKGRGLLVAGIAVLLGAGGLATFFVLNQDQKVKPGANDPVVKTTGQTTPPAIPNPPPSDPIKPPTIAAAVDIKQAESFLAAGKLSECRSLVEKALTATPDDEAWKKIAGDLDRAQGESAITQAETALQAGDLNAATAAASVASTYLGDDQRIAELRKKIDALSAGNKERSRILQEAETLINEGEGKKAEALLAPLVAENATDETASLLLRRARKQHEEQTARSAAVDDRITQGNDALVRKDLDAALLHFTAAQQLDPKNEKAKAGLDQVTKGQAQLTALRLRFEKALKERDLPAAEASLLEMRNIAPGSPTLVLAENEFTNSRLVEETKAKAMANQKAAVVEAALALEKRIQDPTISIEVLTSELAAFIKENGDEAARQAELPRQLEDRRQQVIIAEQLQTLDKAILEKDAKNIDAVVTDTTYQAALKELSTMAGLVFSSSIQSFKRSDNTATATVAIKHALTTFPERTLTMFYTLQRSGDKWTITQATLK